MALLTQTISTLVSDEEGVISISPSDRRNIYSFAQPTSGTYTISVNTDGCQIGDQLVFLLAKGDEGSLTVNFPIEKFTLKFCSSLIHSIILGEDGGEASTEEHQFMFDFYFNGTRFICAYDLG